jgi:hypothetical protein
MPELKVVHVSTRPLTDREIKDLQYQQDHCYSCDTPYEGKYQICPRPTCNSHQEIG